MDLITLYYIFVTLHIAGAFLGAGGAFASDGLFLARIWRGKSNEKELDILAQSGKVVWLGVTFLVLSGFALLWLGSFELLSSPRFQAKATIVAIIILNGIFLHKTHLPFVKAFFGNGVSNISVVEARKSMTWASLSGTISSISWLAVLILAYGRNLAFGYEVFMGIYVAIVILSLLPAYIVRESKLSEKNTLPLFLKN